MQKLEWKKIAIVCDWINDMWWAEVVLEQFLEMFPEAHIFTSVFFQNSNPIFKWRTINTSFIQKIPILNKSHKLALTLRPLAFESFDLSEYDIVISSSSAESKWVITKPNTIHICYCHTPTRYFWSHYHEYLKMMEFWWILNFIWKKIMPWMVHKLRQWDFVAAQRPDYFIANSQNTANRIKKYYNRESEIIYPSVDVSSFNLKIIKEPSSVNRHQASVLEWIEEEFYLYVWRCIPYKKFDLIVDAFNKNWRKLILVTNTNNKLYKELKERSKENIEWKINITKEETKQLFSKAKAFLFPPEEDFGIVPIEAMASWTPVIAYRKGGALETVLEWETWVFFDKQTTNSLNKAIENFEEMIFDYRKIVNHALKFDKEIFKKGIIDFINKKLVD